MESRAEPGREYPPTNEQGYVSFETDEASAEMTEVVATDNTDALHYGEHQFNRHESHSHSDAMSHFSSEPAKHVVVYINGDRFYPGRRFIVNRKHLHDFDGFLTEVTRGINPQFGAVRNIYTPTNGHKIQALEQIENNMNLVAGGIERFRRMGYRDIIARPRMMHTNKKMSMTRVPPKNRLQVPARWRAYIKEPCQIFVYGNGDIIAPAMKLLLTPRQMKTWDLILEHITEKIGIRTGQAVRKLYDLEYHLLHQPADIENGQFYVAVGTEKLKKLPYGQIPSFTRGGHHQISPRRINAPLPPIKSTSKTGVKKASSGESYSKMQNQRRLVKDHSTTNATPASDESIKTKRQPQPPPSKDTTSHEEESVFHAKPVKVKRSPPTAALAHEDQDTIFRGNVELEQAEEVKDDENTKVDLPIDQVVASRVEEEIIETAPDNDSVIISGKDENANNISVDVSQDKVLFQIQSPYSGAANESSLIELGVQKESESSQKSSCPSVVIDVDKDSVSARPDSVQFYDGIHSGSESDSGNPTPQTNEVINTELTATDTPQAIRNESQISPLDEPNEEFTVSVLTVSEAGCEKLNTLSLHESKSLSEEPRSDYTLVSSKDKLVSRPINQGGSRRTISEKVSDSINSAVGNQAQVSEVQFELPKELPTRFSKDSGNNSQEDESLSSASNISVDSIEACSPIPTRAPNKKLAEKTSENNRTKKDFDQSEQDVSKMDSANNQEKRAEMSPENTERENDLDENVLAKETPTHDSELQPFESQEDMLQKQISLHERLTLSPIRSDTFTSDDQSRAASRAAASRAASRAAASKADIAIHLDISMASLQKSISRQLLPQKVRSEIKER